MCYDAKRDRDFYEPFERPIVEEDIEALRDVLLGTSEHLDIALSEIGLDPFDFDRNDKRFIIKTARIRFDKNLQCWVDRD